MIKLTNGESPTPGQLITKRNAAHLSQTAAAKLVYVALRTWQDWEAGKAAMPPGLWELFCNKVSS